MIISFPAVALSVYLFVRYKKRRDPEKYILDIDPDDDIRENVINYNEEGAGLYIVSLNFQQIF